MLPQFKRILFCTQMGPHAPVIFRHAGALARAHGGKIVVLHVHEAPPRDREGLVEGYAGKGALHAAVDAEESNEARLLREKVEEYFHREIGEDDWTEMVERIIVAEGKPREQILRHVDSVGADIVVMGSHRHSLLEVLIGTTTQGVIAKGEVPVLVVPIPNHG